VSGARSVRAGFLILILTQAAHSVEEYVFRLYDVLAPARFISGLFSADLPTGCELEIAREPTNSRGVTRLTKGSETGGERNDQLRTSRRIVTTRLLTVSTTMRSRPMK
jgi:hypothetical protein